MTISSSWQFGEEDDDSEEDALSAEDLQALRRACTLSGAVPSGISSGDNCYYKCGREDSGGDELSPDYDSEDLALLRERFPVPSGLGTRLRQSSATEAFATSLSFNVERDDDEDDDGGDDLETLREVRRRFRQYAERDSAAAVTYPGGDDLLACCRGSGIPTSAPLFLDALGKNRACQRLIRTKLIEVEAKVEQSKAMMERLRCLMGFQTACKKKAARAFSLAVNPRVRLVSSPKPRKKQAPSGLAETHAGQLGPLENDCPARRKMAEGAEQSLASLLQRKLLPWLEKEKEQLAKGIRMQYMMASIESMMKVGRAMEGPLLAGDPRFSEPSPEEMRSFLPMVNWDYLAAAYLPGRRGGECRAMWLSCEDPLINHRPWTRPEDKALLQAITDIGLHDWPSVAARVGTRRTPFQCLVRFQRSLNPHLLNSEWSREEDTLLRASVTVSGEDWQAVAASMNGRTGTQCSERWKKALQPGRNRVGRWDVGEDRRLKVAVALFGASHWNKIAGFVPGRTQAQCRERWVNCLSPSLRLEPWSEEEDAMLRAAAEEHGHCWARVAERVPARTDNQCWRRWKVICRQELPSMRAAGRVKRAAQVRNFVGREKERPSIGPEDFFLAPEAGSADGGGQTAEKRKRGRPPKDRTGGSASDGAARPEGKPRKRKVVVGAPRGGEATADVRASGEAVCCVDWSVAERPECTVAF